MVSSSKVKLCHTFTKPNHSLTGEVYTCPAVYTAAADHTCAVDHGAAAGIPIGILWDPTWGSLGSPKGSHRSPYEASVAALLHCYFVTMLLCSFEPTPTLFYFVTMLLCSFEPTPTLLHW